MTFLVRTLSALGVGGILALSVGANTIPVLANERAPKVAQVAATPLAQKPEKHVKVVPVATRVSHPTQVEQKVAAPVASTKPTQPVVVHPINSAVPAPVQKTAEHQPTPAPKKDQDGDNKSDKGKSEHVASTPAPVQRIVQPVKVADAKQTEALAKQAKDDDRKPLPAACGSKDAVSHAVLSVSGGTATGSFDVSTGCHVTVTLASYGKDTGKFLPQTLFAYVTDDYGQGHHVVAVPIPANCAGQEDLVRGGVIKHLGEQGFYGDRKLAYTASGSGPCGEKPPVVQPPSPNSCDLGVPEVNGVCQTPPPPPIKQIFCALNEHRVGEKCLPNLPPSEHRPPVVVTPQVPVSHPMQTVAPQRLVASKALAVQPTPLATPISRAPLAPNTGTGPSRLAETGLPISITAALGLGGLLMIALSRVFLRRNRSEVEQS